eukprot:s444_g35.t1
MHSTCRGSGIDVAAREGDLPAVRGFLRRDPGSDDSTWALGWAAWRGHADIVEFALSQNVDVDSVDIADDSGPGPQRGTARSRRRRAAAEVRRR